jgi:hypothetical protein
LLLSVLLSFHEVNISKSSHVKLNQQTKKTVLSDQNEDEGSRSTKERKGYISKRSDIKRIQSQDCRSLIQGGDPNEEREISPSMEKIKKGVRLTQPVASQWQVSGKSVASQWPFPGPNSGFIQLKIGRGQLSRAHTNGIIQKNETDLWAITKEDWHPSNSELLSGCEGSRHSF